MGMAEFCHTICAGEYVSMGHACCRVVMIKNRTENEDTFLTLSALCVLQFDCRVSKGLLGKYKALVRQQSGGAHFLHVFLQNMWCWKSAFPLRKRIC